MENGNTIRKGGKDGFRSDTKQKMIEFLNNKSCLSLEATPQNVNCAKLYGEKCREDSECATGLTCFPKLDVIGTKLNSYCGKAKKAGEKCQKDSDCMGYCQLLRCRSGVEGDLCKFDRDCQGDLSCIGLGKREIEMKAIESKQFDINHLHIKRHLLQIAGTAKCRKRRGAGEWCTADSDCTSDLYCHLLKCRRGKEGDPCKYHNDCRKYSSKNYCRYSRCYDGSYGDKCEYSSQCQSGRSCKCPRNRRWCIGRRKSCK